MDDDKIIGLYWKREESAIKETSEKYGREIFRLAKRLLCLKEEAEECENDTYFEAWKTIPPQKPFKLFAYLMKLCRNIACNRLDYLTARKRRSIVVELTRELSECIPDPTVDFDEIFLGNILTEFLYSLPETPRTLFLERYWYGESIQYIAHKYQFSESKVKMTLMRSREKLREKLRKEGYEWTE